MWRLFGTGSHVRAGFADTVAADFPFAPFDDTRANYRAVTDAAFADAALTDTALTDATFSDACAAACVA